MMIKIIDVSEHQGKIDWQKVKAAGITGAIIRLGYVTSKGNNLDKQFKNNVTGALNAGISIGFYLYSYAQDLKRVQQEIDFVVKTLQPYKKKIGYPIFYDCEDQLMGKCGKKAITGFAKAFCEGLKKHGFYPGIYANLNWVKNYLDIGKLPYDLWLAQYSNKMTYSGEVGMWQYTDKGRVNGIVGNVDTSYCYKCYPDLMRKEGWNGFSK